MEKGRSEEGIWLARYGFKKLPARSDQAQPTFQGKLQAQVRHRPKGPPAAAIRAMLGIASLSLVAGAADCWAMEKPTAKKAVCLVNTRDCVMKTLSCSWEDFYFHVGAASAGLWPCRHDALLGYLLSSAGVQMQLWIQAQCCPPHMHLQPITSCWSRTTSALWPSCAVLAHADHAFPAILSAHLSSMQPAPGDTQKDGWRHQYPRRREKQQNNSSLS